MIFQIREDKDKYKKKDTFLIVIIRPDQIVLVGLISDWWKKMF